MKPSVAISRRMASMLGRTYLGTLSSSSSTPFSKVANTVQSSAVVPTAHNSGEASRPSSAHVMLVVGARRSGSGAAGRSSRSPSRRLAAAGVRHPLWRQAQLDRPRGGELPRELWSHVAVGGRDVTPLRDELLEAIRGNGLIAEEDLRPALRQRCQPELPLREGLDGRHEGLVQETTQ